MQRATITLPWKTCVNEGEDLTEWLAQMAVKYPGYTPVIKDITTEVNDRLALKNAMIYYDKTQLLRRQIKAYILGYNSQRTLTKPQVKQLNRDLQDIDMLLGSGSVESALEDIQSVPVTWVVTKELKDKIIDMMNQSGLIPS